MYLSKSPLLPLIMLGAASIFGDKPSTYRAVVILINAFLFGMLAFFAGRVGGRRAAVWTLVFSALSTYALYYSSTQTFEQLCLLGMVSAIFLYFEWLRSGRRAHLNLSILAYLVGFAADYLAFFAGLVICLHWLFLRARRTKAGLWEILAFPTATVLYVLGLILLMQRAELPLEAWYQRAFIRATGSSWSDLFRALGHRLLAQIGPTLAVSGAVYPIVQCRETRAGHSCIESRLRLEIVSSLLVAGLCPIILFRNAYVEHGFWTMFVVPYFAVAGAFLMDNLMADGAWRKRVGVVVILGFVVSSARGVGVIVQNRLGHQPSPTERVATILLDAQDQLVPGDTLLVFGDEPTKITAFYVLRIPVTDGSNSETWQEFAERRDTDLILSTDPRTFQMVASMDGAELLRSDEHIALFRLSR